jgi:hypothetical protein
MEVEMRKLLLATALAVVAGSALAAAHFMSAEASVNSDGALVVSFDETGLGNGNVNYTLSANGAAVYACFNKGGKNPSATNKVGPSALDVAEGTFKAKNGRVQGSLLAGPPGSGTFSCPSGQDMVLACVKYTNVVLTDTTNQVSPDEITGTFARIFRASLQQCSTL